MNGWSGTRNVEFYYIKLLLYYTPAEILTILSKPDSNATLILSSPPSLQTEINHFKSLFSELLTYNTTPHTLIICIYIINSPCSCLDTHTAPILTHCASENKMPSFELPGPGSHHPPCTPTAPGTKQLLSKALSWTLLRAFPPTAFQDAEQRRHTPQAQAVH